MLFLEHNLFLLSVLFCFVLFCFVCCSIWLDPIIFVLEIDTLRFHCLEHSSFHFCYSVSVHFLLVLRFPLLFCSELDGLLQLYMISSLVFDDYHLWELFQTSLLVLEKSKIFHAYSGAMGSLFRLWLGLWHVMLDVILIMCLVIYDVSWLVSNN